MVLIFKNYIVACYSELSSCCAMVNKKIMLIFLLVFKSVSRFCSFRVTACCVYFLYFGVGFSLLPSCA